MVARYTHHQHHWHVPKGPNIYFLALGGFAGSLLALIFFVVAWLTAGSAYIHEFGGMATLAGILAALLVFSGLSMIEKP